MEIPIWINWILISAMGIASHHWLFPEQDRDTFDNIMFLMLYLFASPVIHIIIWILQGKPSFNFKSIVSLLMYIILCVNLLINIL